jgi:hypothetical protein
VTVGLIAAHANALLEVYRNSAVSAIAAVYVQLHTGDPGAAGTSNVSAVTTRNAITWNAASAGSMAINAINAYSMTTTETISHVSFWSASSAGTCYRTAALTSSIPVVNGSSFDLTTCTFSYTPIAA